MPSGRATASSPGRGGGIGGPALVDQAAQRALLAVASASSWARWASQAALKAARASLGATPMRAAMSQKARRTSFAFRAFCTSQEMTRSLSSRKVCATYRWPTGTSSEPAAVVARRIAGHEDGVAAAARLSRADEHFEARQHSSTERRSPPSAMALSVGRSPPRCARWIRRTWSTARRSDRTEARGECPPPAHRPNLSFGARATSSGIEAPAEPAGANKQYRQS